MKKLVKRCNSITHLDLSNTTITNDSVHSIIEQLKASLEKLDLYETNVDFATLIHLKSMPALKILICGEPFYDGVVFQPFKDHCEDIENLKQQLSQISINEEESLRIAQPFKIVNKSYDSGWIWEIRAKQHDLFAKR